MVEGQDEENEEVYVLEAKEASDDELEEAVAMMTIAEQRRKEVDPARQFFRKPQSSEERKARLDKLKQKFPCARCGQSQGCQLGGNRGARDRGTTTNFLPSLFFVTRD